ncbi:MAG: shikimate dehydrogenase [Pseudomonadota bacterium]
MTVLRAGLIGSHIGNSRFSAALRHMCADLGIDLSFTPIDTAGRPNFAFDTTVRSLIDQGWDGVTVTHPHKPEAARVAGARMAEEVRHLGAANILMFDRHAGHIASGHNTDFSGFLGAWQARFGTAAPGRVAMAGAGGVAEALGAALIALGAETLTIWDTVPDRAEGLARRLGAHASAVPAHRARDAVAGATGLVNATPLGMAYQPGMAFQADDIGPQSWAFDAVYTPTDTRFLRAAAARGLSCLTGFDLFSHMAVRSFQVYTGITPDAEKAIAALAPLKPEDVSA